MKRFLTLLLLPLVALGAPTNLTVDTKTFRLIDPTTIDFTGSTVLGLPLPPTLIADPPLSITGGHISINLSGYVPVTRTVNGHPLSADVSITAADIGAPSGSGTSTGTNTGDQDLSGLVPKTTTVNGYPLSSNVILSAADVGAPSGSGTSTGTNTGDQTITLTGAVTGSGTGTFSTSLANTTVTAGSYTNANLTVGPDGRLTAAANGVAGGGVLWGTITGTLSNQTDLQTALNAKAASGANADITGLALPQVLSANGAASTPALLLNGTWFTGGSGTTNSPQLAIEQPGATPNYNGNGQALGINSSSGYVGDLISAQVNGTSKFRVIASGTVNVASSGSFASTGTGGQFQVQSPTGGFMFAANDLQLYRNINSTLEVNNGTAGQWAPVKLGIRDAITSGLSYGLTVGHQSTGTPAANFGSAILFNADSATGADRQAGVIGVGWTDPTDATRSSYLTFQIASSGSLTNRMRLFSSGGLAISSTTDPGASAIQLGTSGGLRIPSAGIFEVNNGTAGQWTSLKAGTSDTNTNTIANGLIIGHQTSVTPVAGFGIGVAFNLNSDTTADRQAARITSVWTDPADATRSAYIDFQLVNSASALGSKMRLFPSGGLDVGNTATDPGAGIVNANVGFQIANAAASGKFLIGNGTNYIASTATHPTSAGTAGKVVVSDGTNFVSSTPTFPNASATARKKIVSDGTNWVASTETWAVPGTAGNVLLSDGTNWTASPTPWGKAVVTATVDQTAIAETSHVAFTVPANSAIVGTTYRITGWGDMDNGTTAITFTPHIRWGGTAGVSLLATPTVVGTTTAQTGKTWRAVALVTIRTIGATGTAVAEMLLSNHEASTTGAYAADETDSGGTAITIDTTASQSLALTWALSATTGTPHVRTYGGFVELIK